MSYIYDQTILDGIISKVLKSCEELERTIAEGPFDKTSIADAAEALAAETEPVDVQVQEQSDWFAIAKHICVDPFRRKP